jgi:hypothetical protein
LSGNAGFIAVFEVPGTLAENPSLSATDFQQRRSPSKTSISRTGGFCTVEHPGGALFTPICHIRARFSMKKLRASWASARLKSPCETGIDHTRARCATHSLIDLSVVRDVRRRPDTPIWKLEASLRCRRCTEGAPLRRWKPAANLVRLRKEKTLAFEPWYSESER